ncbi:MAG: YjbQ family protein [Chloroflexi bacterium]|nr:YjbQ family protein [Chloroflexota bacterium]
MVVTSEITLNTRGHCDIRNITSEVAQAVASSQMENGTVTIFCPGATGALTTVEYESGTLADLQAVFDEIAPADRDYHHGIRSGDDNGHSHVRAALIGPSLTVPFINRKLTLGTWQQIVFFDFDTRARARRLILQMIGQ